MTSISSALHRAVFSKVKTALAGKAAVIAGRLAAGQSWPAVHIGDVSVASNDGVGSERSSRTLQITVFSSSPGPAEAMDLIGDIKEALHRQPLSLTLSVGNVILMSIAREVVQLDSDGMTYTGTCWLEVQTSP